MEHPTFAVIEPVCSFDNAALTDWRKRRLAPDAEVFSDGLDCCFRRVVALDHAHAVLETANRRAATEVKDARWVNVMLGNVKRASAGATTPCGRPSTRGEIWPKRRTDSTGAFALPTCCRDWRGP